MSRLHLRGATTQLDAKATNRRCSNLLNALLRGFYIRIVPYLVSVDCWLHAADALLSFHFDPQLTTTEYRLYAGVYRGPALGVWFRLTQNFASQGGHIALSTEYVANEIEQRIAFTPIEVGVGNLACLVA